MKITFAVGVGFKLASAIGYQFGQQLKYNSYSSLVVVFSAYIYVILSFGLTTLLFHPIR